MITEDDFMREIRGNPHDWTPRLIHADWLEDQADPRAELVRLTHQVLHGCWGDAALHSRLAELYRDGLQLPTPVYWSSIGRSKRLTLQLIPPGSFTMGSPASELRRFANETQVLVTLTRGFWLGTYVVTQDHWENVMDEEGAAESVANLPQTDVAWPNAQAFCDKLTTDEHISGHTVDDWRYDLPTEAQWEYACRAGTATAYAFGDKITKAQANFSGNAVSAVGSYKPNAFGLYDMHGNVCEWCRDAYAEDLPGGEDPYVKGSAEDCRVLRGGSWDNNATLSRSADRYWYSPDDRNYVTGFRVALVQN